MKRSSIRRAAIKALSLVGRFDDDEPEYAPRNDQTRRFLLIKADELQGDAGNRSPIDVDAIVARAVAPSLAKIDAWAASLRKPNPTPRSTAPPAQRTNMNHTDFGAAFLRFQERDRGPIVVIDSRQARLDALNAQKAAPTAAPERLANDVSDAVKWTQHQAAAQTAQPIARKAAPLVRGKSWPAPRGPESVADADSIFGAVRAAATANRARRSEQR